MRWSTSLSRLQEKGHTVHVQPLSEKGKATQTYAKGEGIMACWQLTQTAIESGLLLPRSHANTEPTHTDEPSDGMNPNRSLRRELQNQIGHSR